ncbi:MAG TPA: TrkA C-terminal domain-containing protein [Aquihabitans sp.]|nr:TrkA C-terminal domain-containing protein [Aquihabitans sp.]
MTNDDPTARPAAPIPRRLPGVGHHLDLHDDTGRPVQAVRRRDGTLELHAEGAVVVLDALSARSLGALASGHLVVRPELLERADRVLGGLELDWIRLAADAAAVGASIEELAIRRRTGVTIVAILRGSLPLVDPDPTTRLEAGDELVVACRAEERASLERFLHDGGA